MSKDTKTTHTYYQLVGTINGISEVIFGSYDKADCTYELEAERDSLKADGYKKIKIVSSSTTEEPDLAIYSEYIPSEASEYIPSEAFRRNTNTVIDQYIVMKSTMNGYGESLVLTTWRIDQSGNQNPKTDEVIETYQDGTRVTFKNLSWRK